MSNIWTIKTNFPEADFWLINKGSINKLGQPVKEFQSYLTGIKCPDFVLPSYGYYLCLYIHQTGFWQSLAVGSTDLKNLRISDIKSTFSVIIDGRFNHQ
jgi:hypothetical protein